MTEKILLNWPRGDAYSSSCRINEGSVGRSIHLKVFRKIKKTFHSRTLARACTHTRGQATASSICKSATTSYLSLFDVFSRASCQFFDDDDDKRDEMRLFFNFLSKPRWTVVFRREKVIALLNLATILNPFVSAFWKKITLIMKSR